MATDNTYTAADFERYHSGEMSVEEMHALEKAALADPFLADALEGYANTNTPVKDIAELKQKLFENRKRKNIFFLSSKQNPLLRIAAVFILVAGIGYLAYQLNYKQQTNELLSLHDTVQKKIEQPAPVKPDSVSMDKSNAVAFNSILKNKANIRKAEAPKDEYKTQSPDPKAAQEDLQAPPSFLKDQNQSRAMLSQLKKENSRDMNLVKGRIVDTHGNAILGAAISNKENNLITLSDSTGRFKMVRADSTMYAKVSALGYKTKEKKLTNSTEEVITMEPEDQQLAEVVVTAMGQKRSEKSLRRAMEGKVPGLVIVTDSAAVPENGWQNFTGYVQSNITIPKDKEGKNYKGKVILSFEINRKGNPHKIKVQQSLCTSCDEEAIRLLKKGPKWKYPGDKKQAVTIEF